MLYSDRGGRVWERRCRIGTNTSANGTPRTQPGVRPEYAGVGQWGVYDRQ